jgi:hypothetical protein
VLLLIYAAARTYRDYPALDRSRDRRAAEIMAALTEGIDDQRAILVTDLNWQLQNGLAYFTKVTRPEVAVARMPEVLSTLRRSSPIITRSAATSSSPSARARRSPRRTVRFCRSSRMRESPFRPCWTPSAVFPPARGM